MRRTHDAGDLEADLDLGDENSAARVQVVKQFVPDVQENCEFIEGATPAELADRLMERLREERILS